MTEAWMKRGSERQDFLDKLKREIIEEEEESHNRLLVQIPLTKWILYHLATTDGVVVEAPQVITTKALFYERILPQIQGFARTKEEELALVADLLSWEAQSLVNRFKQPLQTQEIMEPEKVFNGRKAMDQVE